jgi:hypothetical protein
MKAAPLLATLLFSVAIFAQPPRQCVVVAGCESKINEKKWKDFRISFGVTNCIAEELYNSGAFRLIEEKGAIKEKLSDVRQKLWSGAYKEALPELDSLKNDSQSIAFGRLVYFGTPRSSVSMGPFGGSENAVVIKAEVVLMAPGGGVITGKGEGQSTRMAMTTLFKFNDERVFFEQTEIGQALQKAIKAAATDCVGQLKKRNPKDGVVK